MEAGTFVSYIDTISLIGRCSTIDSVFYDFSPEFLFTPLPGHRLAQMGERRSAEREVKDSNPGQTNSYGRYPV